MKLNDKILLAAVLVLGIVMWNSFSQDGVGDLRGGFEEVASYRNENNTGPIQRVYIVSVEDTLWSEMRQYGDYMLHSKLGNTKVYFFHKDAEIPTTAVRGDVNFSTAFNENCLAKYEKNASGLVRFDRYPLR